MQNSVISTRITSFRGSQPSSAVFACETATSGPWITSLYGSQTSPVILCMLNSVISARITILYGYHPSSVAFGHKTAPFGPELQVSMVPRPRLWFCSCKKARLASELLVTMGSNPHLCFLHAKQRLLDQNNKSLWVPDFSCRFVDAKQSAYYQNY